MVGEGRRWIEAGGEIGSHQPTISHCSCRYPAHFAHASTIHGRSPTSPHRFQHHIWTTCRYLDRTYRSGQHNDSYRTLPNYHRYDLSSMRHNDRSGVFFSAPARQRPCSRVPRFGGSRRRGVPPLLLGTTPLLPNFQIQGWVGAGSSGACGRVLALILDMEIFGRVLSKEREPRILHFPGSQRSTTSFIGKMSGCMVLAGAE